MRKDSLFRLLVAADIALALLTIAAEFAFNFTLPQPLRAYVWTSFTDWSLGGTLLFFLWIAVVAFTVISWIGLLSFWWPSRMMYVGAWIGMLAVLLLSGASVLTAPGAMLDTLSQITSGIVIGMMFFNDEVKQRFDEAGLVAAEA